MGIFNEQPRDTAALAFMRPVQHVFFRAATVDCGSYLDLELRFIRPLEARDEQGPVRKALGTLVTASGLVPLGTAGAVFDGAAKKGEHSTLTTSFPCRQSDAVKRLADDLNAAQDVLYNETRRATRRFEPEIAHLVRRGFGQGPSP